jgi:hypothetical protein
MKVPEGPESGHEAIAGFLIPAEEGAPHTSFEREAKCDVGCKMRDDMLYIFHL